MREPPRRFSLEEIQRWDYDDDECSSSNSYITTILTTVVHHNSKMKVTATAAVLLAAASSTDAWSQPTRSTLRSLGKKSVSFQGPSRVVGASMKMEGE